MKKFMFSIMLVFAALFAMPTMAVETTGTADYVTINDPGNPAVIVANLDVDPGIVSQFRRTSVSAYKAQSEQPKLNSVNMTASCTGYHKTGYASNEVGWR